ncbi:IS630 family transposase [Novacetimonas pomaceti]|uniref:IS630 family transposase n=1 Tax=Novacetimonas pomaceti TaxID=2021998 RepID=A0A318QHA5_9PROT|nr:IS630 family transposase [Novacetimonas pomaceti]PYD74739.1 IS630 family transposase [Novacetimonas pomaceti]
MAGIGRPQERVLCISESEREELERISRSHSAPHSVVRRAQIVLASADGETNTAIARRLGTTNPTVCHWRKRWFELGLVGLYGEARPGRPRTHDEEKVAQLLRTVLQSKPADGTHWTVRSAASVTGLSKSTVGRMLALFGVQPHRSKSFKLSTDPLFVDKVKDIVGLYLNPPDHAVVLCVDEKTQIQALERTQPVLPLGLGYLEGVTHDYVRHGTTTLFAALDIANGQVLTQCRSRHRHQEFLGFLKHIEAKVPSDLDVHLVVDNYAAHKHPKVRAWLAVRPRFHVHYTPTYASWLNQVERWFALLTERQIRRASFVSAKDLTEKINAFVQTYNARAKPFVWTATSEAILEKVERLCKAICGTGH